MRSKNRSYNIPERFLRQLWKNRHFFSPDLRTTDKRPVEIISIGKSNNDSGPDFINASIRIGGALYRGDVEIHQDNNDWFEHKHQNDQKYNSVILHVIFDAESATRHPVTQSKRIIPVLALDKYVRLSFGTTWEVMILDERAERLGTLKCYPENGRVEPSVIGKWLGKLAVERMELKVRRFEERLKGLIEEERLRVSESTSRYGDAPFGLNPEDLPLPVQKYSTGDFRKINYWEQLLYEGVMEALGYSKNQKPFRNLAQKVRVKFLTDSLVKIPLGESVAYTESILFGTAGLLAAPKKIMDAESKKYLRVLRQIWKRNSQHYAGHSMQQAEWQFFRLRPENFPTVRIAGAARLINSSLKRGCFKSIIQLLKNTELKDKDRFIQAEQWFMKPADGFWVEHFRFGERSKTVIKTLIGKSRADEIIINAVIPICLLYARLFRAKDVREGAMALFDYIPSLSKNTITKVVDSQLIKSRLKLSTAKLHQGALQLYKFYCADNRCDDCVVGRIIFR